MQATYLRTRLIQIASMLSTSEGELAVTPLLRRTVQQTSEGEANPFKIVNTCSRYGKVVSERSLQGTSFLLPLVRSQNTARQVRQGDTAMPGQLRATNASYF